MSGLKIIKIIGNGLKARVIISVGIGKNIYFPLTHVIFNSTGIQISTNPIKAMKATPTAIHISQATVAITGTILGPTAAIHISQPTVAITGTMATTLGPIVTIINNNNLAAHTHPTFYSGSKQIPYLKVWKTQIHFGLLHVIFLGFPQELLASSIKVKENSGGLMVKQIIQSVVVMFNNIAGFCQTLFFKILLMWKLSIQ